MLWHVVLLALRLVFAVGVYTAGERLERTGRGTELVGPLWWALAVLPFDFVAIGVFWALHYVPFFRRAKADPEPEEREGGLLSGRNWHRRW